MLSGGKRGKDFLQVSAGTAAFPVKGFGLSATGLSAKNTAV
jgi:hypothetical protein